MPPRDRNDLLRVLIRNDLNGLRVRLPRHRTIYLIDQGKKREIPYPQVYNELFKDERGIVDGINIHIIKDSHPLPETAILFRVTGSPKFFF